VRDFAAAARRQNALVFHSLPLLVGIERRLSGRRGPNRLGRKRHTLHRLRDPTQVHEVSVIEHGVSPLCSGQPTARFFYSNGSRAERTRCSRRCKDRRYQRLHRAAYSRVSGGSNAVGASGEL
jgi:hypothetical protein